MTDKEIIARAKEVYEQKGRLIVHGDPVYTDDEESASSVIEQHSAPNEKGKRKWEGAWVMAWVFVPSPYPGKDRDEV